MGVSCVTQEEGNSYSYKEKRDTVVGVGEWELMFDKPVKVESWH